MIHIFLGTKAQLIKMAPIMKSLQDESIEYNFIFSGQHKETIDDLRHNFGLKEPDITLHQGSDITSVFSMLIWSLKLIVYSMFNRKKIWKGDKNGIVLNHGDTFSTLIGSLLAKLGGHKNAHIESGLRSFKVFHPFPEELTRLFVFRLSDYYFCPGEWAVRNLAKYRGEKINTQANTLYDALKTVRSLSAPNDLLIPEHEYGIVTLHRFENLYDKDHLTKIVNLLEMVANKIPLLFILHKPTLKKLEETKLLKRLMDHPNINTRPRYDYLRFITLLIRSRFVISDGGSNQEECYYLGKPCLLFRHATERQEGLDKNAVVSHFDEQKIMNFVDNYQQFEQHEQLFDQTPTSIIVDSIRKFA